MAADILLYQADCVPVGVDQRQHLEIARDIAQRFNNAYSPTFTIPEGVYMKVGAKINDLQDPAKKMSKSGENPNGAIFLSDDRDTILRKFKRAVTDSDSLVKYDPETKPGVSNLLSIYSVFSDKSIQDAEADFAGKGYGDFKLAVGEVVADKLAPIQAEQAKLLADKTYLDGILKSGAERAAYMANKTLFKVYKKVGFYQL
jgi:tryptophanyl-tRNA synthetase